MGQNVIRADDRSITDLVQDQPLLKVTPDPVILISGTERTIEPVRARPYDPNSFCDDYLREGTCHGY